MKKINIKSFGERGDDQWYAGKDNIHIPCTEKMIEELWEIWILANNVKRADTKEYEIFVFAEPIIYEL